VIPDIPDGFSYPFIRVVLALFLDPVIHFIPPFFRWLQRWVRRKRLFYFAHIAISHRFKPRSWVLDLIFQKGFQEDEKQRAGKNSPARLGTCAPTLYFKASRWVIPWPLSRLKICSEAANPGAPFRLQGGGHNRDPRPTDFFVLQFISRQRSLRQSFLYPARILRQQFNFIKYLTGGQRSQDAFADYLPFLHQVLNVRFFRPGLVIMNTFTVIIMKWFTLVEEIKTHESNVHFFRSRHSHS